MFIDSIHRKKNNEISPLDVALVGTPDLIDSGELEYLFSMKCIGLTKFFEIISDHKKIDYAILVKKKCQADDFKLQNKKIYLDVLDLSDVRAFDYKDFLIHNYGGCNYDAQNFEDMCNYLSNFKVIEYYIASDVIYYLGKNP